MMMVPWLCLAAVCRRQMGNEKKCAVYATSTPIAHDNVDCVLIEICG